MGGESSVQGFVKSGKGRAILQIGGKPEGGVPLARDLPTSPEGKALIALISSQAELSRFTAGPPEIPPARLAVLRNAYKQALEDPELRKQLVATGSLPDYMNPEELGAFTRSEIDRYKKVLTTIGLI